MALADLTREAVLRAMAEYNELGGEDFLNKYGYRPARSCFCSMTRAGDTHPKP